MRLDNINTEKDKQGASTDTSLSVSMALVIGGRSNWRQKSYRVDLIMTLSYIYISGPQTDECILGVSDIEDLVE